MKKFLLMFGTVLVLTVCLCVPVFAVDGCSHSWAALDGYGSHRCSDCNSVYDCSDYDGDFSCDVCGARNFWGEFSGCSHSEASAFVLYRDDDHFLYCPYCSVLVRMFDYYCFSFGFSPDDLAPEQEEVILALSGHSDNCLLFESEAPYTLYESGLLDCSHFLEGVSSALACFYDDVTHYLVCIDCDVCVPVDAFFGGSVPHVEGCELATEYGGCAPLYIYESGVYSCPYIFPIGQTNGDYVGIVYDDTEHYLFCTDCGARFPLNFVIPDCAHSPDGDVICDEGGFGGLVVLGSLSDFDSSSTSILPDVTSGVTSAASWVSTFANTIMSTPILLISAILAFIGFGIGIFKRLRT